MHVLIVAADPDSDPMPALRGAKEPRLGWRLKCPSGMRCLSRDLTTFLIEAICPVWRITSPTASALLGSFVEVAEAHPALTGSDLRKKLDCSPGSPRM